MIRSALAFALVDKFATVAITITTMAVISRILTPAEVGQFLVAAAIVVLIEAFRDFGVAACIVREPELTRPFVRTATTVVTLLSLALGALVFALSGAIAAYYGDPALATLIAIGALGFLFAPVANPRLALLKRDMAFGRIAAISVTATLANAVASIALALAGFGAASLVWGSVLAAVVSAMLTLMVRRELWMFLPSLHSWRQVVPFGAWSSAVTVLGMLYDHMPRLILGRVLGFTAVGLFGRSLSLVQMPERMVLSAVQPVVLSDMSTRARQGSSLAAPYLSGVSHLTALQWPALVVLALLADPVVRIALGGQWLEAVPLVRILAIGAMGLFPLYLAFPAFVALGRIRDMALASLISLPLAMAIIWGAASFSLEVVAWATWVVGPLQAFVMLMFLRRHVGFAWRELAAVAGRSFAVAMGTGAIPAAMVLALGASLSLVETALALVGAFVGWLASLALTGHPLHAEIRHIAGEIARRAGERLARRTALSNGRVG